MAFINSLDIGGSALSAQRLRADIIMQNIANQESYNTAEGDPYRRQLVVFSEKRNFRQVYDNLRDEDRVRHHRGTYYLSRQNKYSLAGVVVADVVEDPSDFIPVYDPDNPLADEDGYIYKSNVSNAKEQIDLLAAQRSYEANASAVAAVKAMLTSAMRLNGK